jgi:hypothetical protein
MTNQPKKLVKLDFDNLTVEQVRPLARAWADDRNASSTATPPSEPSTTQVEESGDLIQDLADYVGISREKLLGSSVI